ncbi:hypothetical protein R5R35_010892 [Gryllus longicercus]|uniref:Ran-GTPase activating protein 1 C-terminal domain-containing protein n=1 Tax=Gryllus longicercus TaxID=2509291 RepID=A0AAN9YVZ1_9ORTH
MTEVDLDEVTRQLQKTSVGSSSGVSFKGRSLKLNTEDDAREVVEAIEACSNLHFLDLEGNSLGVDSAKAIAKALEAHGELKRALWKDLFTGRMKTEIPKALQYLGSGLMLASAQLTELELSDNAFGPIGVEGMVVLLQSATCYSLEILKLNNNGLGISGGKMLAKGLLDCYTKGKEIGKPLRLRVFVAGRNRLENDGARALAEVFKTVGTLEEIHMPQNGIYHVGISALAEAFKCNPNLEVLNLNDNTVTLRGVSAIVGALPVLQKLREIDLGDCLLRTKGAVTLAAALTDDHKNLEKLLLESNEIGSKGGIMLAKAVRNKTNLKKLALNGNQFGEQGISDLSAELEESGQISALDSLEDDEGEEDEEDEEEEEEEEEDSEHSGISSDESDKDHGTVPESNGDIKNNGSILLKIDTPEVPPVVKDFLENSTPERFLALGENRSRILLHEISSCSGDAFVDNLLVVLMKVSSLSVCNAEQVRQAAFSCCNLLYEELFKWAKKTNKFSIVNNALLVHLGLIKSEDKSLKLTWNIDGCMLALENAMKQPFFPEDTQEIVHVFRGRRVIDIENGTVISV